MGYTAGKVPDKPTWLTRVPGILQFLESPQAPPFLDRPAMELLFGLRRRQSIDLMRRMGGYQVGKTFLVDRQALLRFLTAPQQQAASEQSVARKQKVVASLGEARQMLASRRIPIPATAASSVAGLPPGIQLDPGRLTVIFEQPVELLQKLFALSQALTRDYEQFAAALTPGSLR